jgi:hypothetical protein
MKSRQTGTRMRSASANRRAADGNLTPDSHALTSASETPMSKAIRFCGNPSVRRQRRRFAPKIRALKDGPFTDAFPLTRI